MIKRLHTILFPLFIFLCHGYTYSQHSLKIDSTFITAQSLEYQKWLNATELNKIFKVSTLSISDEKLILELTPSIDSFSCEEMQNAWKQLYRDFSKSHQHEQLLHEKLLDILSILTEVSTDSIEIKISCGNDDYFSVEIFGDQMGRIHLKEHLIEQQGTGTIIFPFIALQNVNAGEHVDSLDRDLTVRRVRHAISAFLYNTWYKGKGTPVLYNIRIDTSNSYYNEFSWKFSHLSNEVLKDQGYYEFHIVHVKIQDINGFIEVNWEFTGKFGSGILYPPREHDYKLMESYFKEEEQEYENRLFKTITQFLYSLK